MAEDECCFFEQYHDSVQCNTGDSCAGRRENDRVRLPQNLDIRNEQAVKPDASTPSSEWIARIFAGAHVAIGISRLADNRFVAVNDAFERLFGLKRKAILGHTSLELGLWPVPAERAQLMKKLRRGEAVRAFEARYRKRSGETGDLQISASIVSFDGEPYMVGLLSDISDRKNAERAARTHQLRLDTVLKLSSLLVFHQDRQLRYTWVANPALNSTQDDLIGRNDDDILGKDATPLTRIKRRVLRTGVGERKEVWVSWIKGTGCFDLIVEPEHDADGRITGLICAATDITSRKQAEEHLLLQTEILEALEEGVNLVDAKGIIYFTNPKFDAMFGYAPGELIGRHASILNAPGEGSPEAAAEAIMHALRRDGRWSGELRSRRKDGSEFWSRANVVTTTHPAFGPVWISVQSDVTALRRTREERDLAHRMLHRLSDHVQDEVESQRSELAREVHDEIGATLTGIRMRLDSLTSSYPDEDLADIRAMLDRAQQTTRVLCSRLRPPMLDDLGLLDTLRWYGHDWSRRTGIPVSVRIAAAQADPAEPLRTDLFRMLQELLTNVARHSGATRVGVSLTRSRKALQLRVADNGRGFAPGRSEGFGLLGILERLRRHGGTLDIAPGPGATVTLRIPATAP